MNRWFDRMPIIGKKIPGKITLSFFMLLFAFSLFTIFRSSDRFICFVAMMFSFIGDISLNHNPNHDDQTKTDFICGGIAFIIAHILYCISYCQKITIHRFSYLNAGLIYALFFIIVITVILLIYKRKSNNHVKLFWFGIVYLWITASNYITISSYSYSIRNIESVAIIGGLMFFISDLIIGLEKFFGLKSKLARELVWWLYPIGQIIIIAMA